jgi:RNA polymerase sigma-70 factor (ECF subfamily)
MGDQAQAEWVREALETYEGPLLRYALRLTGDLDAARDVVQEAFLRLWRADRETVAPRLAPWLYTVCRNLAVDVRRKEGRMRTLRLLDRLPSGDPAPVAVAERNETTGAALALLATLPERQQEVVRLKFQSGLSYKEISEVTGLSVSNVGFLLHVAIKTLRAGLVEEPAAAGAEGGGR